MLDCHEAWRGTSTYWIPTYPSTVMFQHLHFMTHTPLSLHTHLLDHIVRYAVEANLELITGSLHKCFDSIFISFSSSSHKFSHIATDCQFFWTFSVQNNLVQPQARLFTLTLIRQSWGSSQRVHYTNPLLFCECR